MSIIKRDSQSDFIDKPYREVLHYKTRSLLRNEIQLIAQNHGQYIHLSQLANRKVQAVFSAHEGYLLGETVWDYYDRPSHLIYCEALESTHDAILVIVHDNQVLFDGIVTCTDLGETLNQKLSDSSRYDVIIAGDLPIVDQPSEGKIYFKPSQLNVFRELEHGVFAHLPINDSRHLVTFDSALKAINLRNHTKALTLVVASVCLFVFALYWSLGTLNKTDIKQVDPYYHYEQALMTASPEAVLDLLQHLVMQAYSLPGWVTANIEMHDDHVRFLVRSLGGTTRMLMDWAKQHHATVKLTKQGAHVDFTKHLPPRAAPSLMAVNQNVLSHLIDRMMRLIPRHSVDILESKSHQMFKETQVRIQFRDNSPEVLLLMAKQLNDLPVKFESFNASMANGLLSGKILLTVLGK